MTMHYQGRLLPCFFVRAFENPCLERATHRVTGQHVLMHVCAAHRERAEAISPPSITEELAPLGTQDVLNAKPLAP